MNVYFIMLIIMTMFGSFASLFLKKTAANQNLLYIIKDGNLYIGAALYIFSAIINIIVLRVIDYSAVLPLTSLTYIWTMFLSSFVLHEKITKRKIGGVGLIIVGAIFVSLT